MTSIILGGISSSEDLAFFVRSKTFLDVGIGLIAGVLGVFTPRINYYFIEHKVEYKKLLKKVLNYIYILSIPLSMYFIVFSKELNILLGGEKFLDAGKSLQIIAPTIIFNSLISWMYFQILIPNKKEKIATKIQIILAAISLLLTFILTKKYNYMGTSITVLIIEILGLVLYCLYINNKELLYVSLINKTLFKSLISGIFMIISIKLIGLQLKNMEFILVGTVVGGIVYLLLLLLFKEEESLEIKKILNNHLKKLFRNELAIKDKKI